jgi:RNA polymerase sigma factor (sigma-70 family)
MCKIAGQEWEDTAQEVRRRLWEKKDQFNPQKASFSTWASRLADNCIKNLIRDSKTKKASYLNDAIDVDDLENE